MNMRARQIESIQSYTRAWAEIDATERMSCLANAFVDGGGFYIDNDVPGGLNGFDELVQFIVETRAALPGIVLSISSEIETLSRWAWFEWEGMVDGVVALRGVDFVEFDDQGRIVKLIDFDHDLTG